MSQAEIGAPHRNSQGAALQAVDREIAHSRSELAASLAEARGVVREIAGLRNVAGFTKPLLAAGLGLVAAMAIRRFFAR